VLALFVLDLDRTAMLAEHLDSLSEIVKFIRRAEPATKPCELLA
jgi:hypothetical protein